MPRQILIVGGGIAGLASAISLSKDLESAGSDVQITIFECAPEDEASSGGAISLTPAAQQCLDTLGVLATLDDMGSQAGIEVDAIDLIALRSGNPLGPLRFTDEKGHGYGGYKGRRVLRRALSQAMLAVARRRPNITVHYNKKLLGGRLDHDLSSVTLHFEDGSSATGDLVLGCDGVHSATRSRLVDPGNTSRYTGISFIQSLCDARRLTSELPFAQTAVHLARNSTLLTSFCDHDRATLFVAAVARVNEHLVERSQAAAATATATVPAAPQDPTSMSKSIRHLVRSHFGQTPLPYVHELINSIPDWGLYPVYQVRQGGKWYTDRVLLLGDAAHAMPPRDESAAYAIEDALLFSQLLARRTPAQPFLTVFQEYERLRRPTVNRAFDASSRLWQSDFDRGLYPDQIRDLMAPAYPPTDVMLGARASAGDLSSARRNGLPAPVHQSFSDLSVYSLTRDLDHAKLEEGRIAPYISSG
ncbi:hypothetical protein BDV59DRAFT_195667 [Aspergillus ambiguus]|uniref:FAD-dependent oxidoreductase n=1 Tax=Aspergillus ambiguus TaxID=176160 RepID=UPI003CCD1B9C